MGSLKPVAFSEKSVVLIRYLPALVVGVLLDIVSQLAFGIAAYYMLDFLLSMPGEEENSIKFLCLILHDICLVLIVSACAYYGYRTLLPKFPDDLCAAILMQLPLTYAGLYLMPPSFDFSSLFSSASSVSAIMSSVSVLVVYSLSKLVRQRV